MIPAGSHRLGPANATLSVRTRRGGAASKAGHDLELLVTVWEGRLEIGDPSYAELTVDPASLRVQRGTGGVQALGEDDKAKIHRTIDAEVLRRRGIEFRSTRVRAAGERLEIEGDLSLAGTTRPIAFHLEARDDGTITARAVVVQTAWGMKPYSALFGALKVLDEVEVELEGRLDAY